MGQLSKLLEDSELTLIYAIVEKTNPHIWSTGSTRTVVTFENKDDADNFYLRHPQYHYKLGVAEPKTIIEIREITLGEVAWWWKPSFP